MDTDDKVAFAAIGFVCLYALGCVTLFVGAIFAIWKYVL